MERKREINELVEEILAEPEHEFFGVNLQPLVHHLRTIEAEVVLLADGIKQAHDAVIVERRKVNALRAERNQYRDGLRKIVDEGTYQGMCPGEKMLVNTAREALEARN